MADIEDKISEKVKPTESEARLTIPAIPERESTSSNSKEISENDGLKLESPKLSSLKVPEVKNQQIVPEYTQLKIPEPQEEKALSVSLSNESLKEIPKMLYLVSSLEREGVGQEEKAKQEKELEGILKAIEDRGDNAELIKSNIEKYREDLRKEGDVKRQLRDLSQQNLEREVLEKELSKIPELNQEEAIKEVFREELKRTTSKEEQERLKRVYPEYAKEELLLSVENARDKVAEESLKKASGKPFLELLELRYERGLYLSLANKGVDEASKRVKQTTKQIRAKERELESLIDAGSKVLREDSEILQELKMYSHEAAKAEVKGLTAYHEHQESEQKKQIEAYEKEKREGGAMFALKEIWTEAKNSAPKILESALLITDGNVAQVVGGIKAGLRGENILQGARDAGAEYIESTREFTNKYFAGGSVFGTDEELASKGNWELALKSLNPLAHVGDAVVSPVFETLNVARIEVSRREALRNLVFGQSVGMVTDLYYGVDSEKMDDLTFSQYQDLERTDSLLRTAHNSFKIAEIAATAAFLGPESLPELAKMMSTSVGMGMVGAAAQEFIDVEGEYLREEASARGEEGPEWSFNWGRFLENTLHQTADSQVFMAGMAGASKVFINSRLGNLGDKLSKGGQLTAQEVKVVKAIQGQAEVMRETVDALDGLGDLSEALEGMEGISLKDIAAARKALGALLNLAVAASDVGDVNLGAGDLIAKKVETLTRSKIAGSQGEVTGVEGLEDLLENVDFSEAVSSEEISVNDNVLRGDLAIRSEEIKVELESNPANEVLPPQIENSEAKTELLKVNETEQVTTSLTRNEVPLVELSLGGESFMGYFSGNSKVFYLNNKQDISRLHAAMKRVGRFANTESQGVAGFYDATSDTIFASKPVAGESHAETIARASILAHENIHRLLNGKSVHNPSVTSIQEEVAAYKRQSEYLAKNGFELTFAESGLEVRESQESRVASEEEIRKFVESKYKEAKIFRAREIAVQEAMERGEVSRVMAAAIEPEVTSTSRGERAQRYVEEQIKLLAHRMETESITYPPGSEVHEKIKDFANQLRDAVNQDPIMKEMGIHFDNEIVPVVYESQYFEAYVIPQVEDRVFISSKALEKLEAADLVKAVLAHEQGHLIREKLRQQEKSDDVPRFRNGEEIWADPYTEAIAEVGIDMLFKRLGSQREEMYSDTYGAMLPLAEIGIHHRRMQALISVLDSVLKGDFSDSTDDEDIKIGNETDTLFTRLAQTHPSDLMRSWTVTQVGNRLNYPHRNLQNSNDKVEISETGLETEILDSVSFLRKHTSLIEGLAVSLSRAYVRILPPSGQMFNETFFSEVGKMSKEEQVKLFQLCAQVVSLAKFRPVNEVISFEQVEEYDDSLSSSEKRYLRDENELEYDPFNTREKRVEIHYNEMREQLLAAEKKVGVEILNSPDLNDLTSGPVNTETIIDSRPILVDAILESLATVPFVSVDGFADSEAKSLFRFNPEKSNVDLLKSRLLSPEYNLSQNLRDLRKLELFEYVASLAKKTKNFENGKEFVQSLLDTCENLKKLSNPNFPEVDDRLVFSLAMHYAFNSKNSKRAKEVFRAMKELGVEHSYSYLELRSGIDSLFGVTDDLVLRESRLSDMREYFPEIVDSYLCQVFRGRKSEVVKQGEILRNMLEPIAFEIKGSRNLHDYWARIGRSPESAILRSALARSENESIKEYLSRLEKYPNKFSENVWRQITNETIRNFDELIEVYNFHCKVCESNFDTPWLDSNKVHSGIAILESGIEKLLSKGNLSEAELGRLEEVIFSIPRTSRRNMLIGLIFENNKNLDVEQMRKYTEKIETEPVREMFKELAEEIHQNSEKLCLELEAILEVSKVRYFKEDDYSKLTKYKIDESSDVNLVFDTFARNREIDKYNIDSLHAVPCTCIDFNNLSPELKKVFEGLGPFRSPNIFRYRLLEYLKENKNPPTIPIRTKPESMLYAEKIAAKFADHLGLGKPEETSIFSGDAEATTKNYLENLVTLESIQPAPTPLRDQWYLKSLEEYKKAGGEVTDQILEETLTLLYLPENRDIVAAEIWSRRDVNLDLEGQIDEVRRLFPYYSLKRNDALDLLRKSSQRFSYEDARRLENLYWVPGLPTPIPTTDSLIFDSAIDSQAAFLSNLDDYEKIDALAYMFGLEDVKPWTVELAEYTLGQSLEKTKYRNIDMSPSARRALLHSIFGGADGIFARNDRQALNRLSNIISGQISVSVGADEQLSAMINDITQDVFHRARFSIHFRTEVLASIIDWSTKMNALKEQVDKEQATSELVFSIFNSAGGAGTRLLQGLLVEPGLMPEWLRTNLRSAQDDSPLGSALSPFHALKRGGHRDIILGAPRGAGSVAEVHELRSVQGQDLDGKLVKVIRTDSLANIYLIRDPLLRLSETIGKYNSKWSSKPIDNIIESCQEELKNLEREANRTGISISTTLASALGAEVSENENTIVLDFTLPNGKKSSLIIPRTYQLEMETTNDYVAAEHQEFFVMGELGDDFESTASSERNRGEKSLKEYYEERGASIEDLSSIITLSFLGSFLNNKTLIADPHFGNAGIVKRDAADKYDYAMLDFGSVNDNFPEEQKNWILRVGANVASSNFDALRNNLLEMAYLAEGELNTSPERLELLDDLIARCEDVSRKVKEEGVQSAVSSLEVILSSLYTQWPLSPETREFCESIRKLQREWGKYLPEESQNKIGQMLFGAVFSATLSGKINQPLVEDFASRLESLKQADLSVDERYQKANSKSDMEFFSYGLENVPKGTKVYLLNPDSKSESDKWIEQELSEDLKFSSKSLSFGKSGRMITEKTVCLFEYKDEDGVIRRINLDGLRALAEGQTEI